MKAFKWKWLSVYAFALALSACGSKPAPARKTRSKPLGRFFWQQVSSFTKVCACC